MLRFRLRTLLIAIVTSVGVVPLFLIVIIAIVCFANMLIYGPTLGLNWRTFVPGLGF